MIPLSLAAKLGGALALLVGFKFFVASIEQRGMDKCQMAHERAATAERERELAAVSEIANEAQRLHNRVQADRNTASGASERLRGAVVGSGLLAPSAPASASSPATDTTGMLAELLDAADRRLRILAEAADASRVAGDACVKSYEALTP